MSSRNKLYYTDPLKAAWMAREFGVVIEQARCKSSIEWEQDFYKSICYDAMLRHDKTYYIHPDSYHVFEPVEGDMVGYYDLDGLFAGKIIGKFGTFKYKTIIQRNNTAFFHPEQEE